MSRAFRILIADNQTALALFLALLLSLPHALSAQVGKPPSLASECDRPMAGVEGFFHALSTPPRSVGDWVTDDFHLLEVGEVWDLQRLESAVQGDYERRNFFSLIRRGGDDQNAWVSYWNRAVITIGGEERVRQWLESAVLRCAGNRWVIQMLHSTRVTDEQIPVELNWYEFER